MDASDPIEKGAPTSQPADLLWTDEEQSGLAPPSPTPDVPGGTIWEPEDRVAVLKPREARPGTPESPAERSPQARRTQRPGPRHGAKPTKRMRMRYLVAAILVALALVADGAYVVFTVESSLTGTEDSLRSGSKALQNAHFKVAGNHFSTALDSSRSAVHASVHPAFLLGTLVPPISADVRATRALSRASELASEAGLEIVDAATAMQATDEGLGASLYRDGRLQFETIAEGAPFVSEAAELLDETDKILAGSPVPDLTVISDALEEARARASDASESARRGSVLLDALPGLLGGEGKRRYFLSFQAPGEARGGGGLTGLYGVLESDDGRVRLTHIGPIGELTAERLDPVSAPAWYEHAYGPFKSLVQWQQANFTPQFPVAAEVFLRMYEQAAGERLDGVVAMDPIALGQLTRATGPLRAPGFDATITSDNAAQVLLNDVYVHFDSDEVAQDNYLAALTRKLWRRLSSGDVDVPELAAGFAEAVRGGHFKMYSRYGGEQSALAELEAAGDFSAYGSNIQLVFHNNAAGNKVDYLLERSIETSVELDPNGDATVSTTLALDNTAPAAPASYLLGPGIRGDAAGLNRMYLNFLMPRTAESVSFGVDGETVRPFEHRETGYPVVWSLVAIPSGESAEVTVVYRVPDAAEITSHGGRFDMAFVPQAVARPDRLSLTVMAPPGYEALTQSSEAEARGRSVRWDGDLDETLEIDVSLTPDQ
ncbi:MAG: DUF4012 domain-containing protein [Actinobacteria bacterium]|nr:DUF4012 domain-containing protein [Actinomycetota bacterium]